MSKCLICDGRGWTGPVHVNFGPDRPGEWRDRMKCSDCGGTGKWSEDRLQAYLAGQQMQRERLARGETIMETARRLGVRPSEISAREFGKPVRRRCGKSRAKSCGGTPDGR